MNPVPEMKTVKSWLPAVMLDGTICMIVGVWLYGGALLPPHPAKASKIPATDAGRIHRPTRPKAAKPKDLKLSLPN